MNKLLEKVEATLTGNLVPIEPSIMSVDVSMEHLDFSSSSEVAYEYRVELRLGVLTTCRKSELERIIKEVKGRISYTLYGDIRDMVHRIKVANYCRDTVEVDKLIDELLSYIS